MHTFKEATVLLLNNTIILNTLTEHADALLRGTIMHMQVVLTQLLYGAEEAKASVDIFNQGICNSFYGRTQHARDVETHEDLRAMQEKMRDEQEINYWLMDIINPDYNKLSEKIKGKNVFFDTSNIFSYHMSHAYYTLEELVNSYNKLHNLRLIG